ncbi:MAG: hypothetical protein LBT89_05685 [Planctomycetaceae bacterium]|jgi:hypothetical protein|nr:hypothetical protein [Planctomycetaceae bacterium]
MLQKTYVRYIAAALLFACIFLYYIVSTTHRNQTLYSSSKDKTVLFGGERVKFSRFAGVETLRREKKQELVDEILKVLAQKGMPADIFTDNVFEAVNIAITLNNAFQDENENRDDLKKLWDNSPLTGWDADKKKTDAVAEILQRYERKRMTVRGMLEQPKTVFYYLFIRDKWQVHIDTEASQYIADYALLEEYAVAKALLKGDIPAAIEAVAYVFRLAQLADDLKVVGVCCDAATTRMRFLEVLQRIILDPKMDKTHLTFLRGMLTEQLDNWKPEHLTWFGDRASGISLYHRIMLSGPNEALESFELDKLQQRGIYNTFPKTFLKNHALDEAFYLLSMQKLIDAGKERFYKRIDTINEVQNSMLKLQDTPIEPVVACLMLDNVDKFMRIFAQDLSRMETAVLALQLALEANADKQQKLIQSSLDPFTGEPYQVQRQDGFIDVSAQNRRKPFRVKSMTVKTEE